MGKAATPGQDPGSFKSLGIASRSTAALVPVVVAFGTDALIPILTEALGAAVAVAAVFVVATGVFTVDLTVPVGLTGAWVRTDEVSKIA